MTKIVKQPYDEGAIHSQPCMTSDPMSVQRWVLLATILGSSMASIDSTIVNVALPTLQTELSATATDVQWVVESYALFVAALILVGGALGDLFGRRRIFTIGVTLFTLASVWCGLSPTVWQLIWARSLQGIGGALLIPGSLAIIGATFPPERRGSAIGIWSGFTAITSAIGPVLGGWIVERASWHWLFFINVPLAAIVLGASLWQVPESRDPEASSRLDWLGAVLAVVGLGGIVYGLIESSSRGFGAIRVWSALAIGTICVGLFIRVESQLAAPMVPLKLFASRTFSGTNLLTFLLYAALGGALFFLPFNLIQVQHYAPTAAGAALVPFPILMFLLSRWSGGLVDRVGARLPLIIGPTIAAFGLGLMTVPSSGGSYWTTFFPAVLVLGLGMAMTVAPLTTTVMGAVPIRYTGAASGINNAVARVAGLLAIAVFGIVLTNVFNASLDRSLVSLDLPLPARQFLDNQRINLAAAKLPPGLSDSTSTALRSAIALAFVAGFRWVMWLAAGLAIASAAISALFLDDRSQRH
ncbi:MFS transporter [Chamaesiphon sp. VAR_69_metabat_338]|uniref:MFS transporter n=1 Tax=Chamaesiphon sp. VAR_69_metabat_338 TaxID=2964704 RepID=UPI00286D99E0|nr:MFS transporter [Chamaesiphon sp. VAR_69_metabat_338]